jgi:hypothetical protein
MRRRRPLDVWPAYADLMTVLAVLGLFAAAAQLRLNQGVATKAEAPLLVAQRHIATLNDELATMRGELAAGQRLRAQEERRLQSCTQAAARNQQMFSAIQEVQTQIDEISRRSGLTFGADQSLEFGEDLVTFARNEVTPTSWQPDGRMRLRRFCEAVSAELARARSGAPGIGSRLASMFVIEVEGHTDSTRCPGDPHCNWPISSGRAANFAVFMRSPEYCPGGRDWDLRPIGYADTQPPVAGSPQRRISLRITPAYGRLIAELTALSH